MDYFEYIQSPMGPVKIHANDEAVTQCYFCGESDETLKFYFRSVPEETGNPVTHEAAKQLREYFDGRRKEFTLPLMPSGTWFQRMVWEGLQAIPYGELWTYGELAHWIGHPNAFRAVGQANGRNPIGIIIPCHRVVAAHGKLGGYTGGLQYKEFLLTLEGSRDRVE